MSAIAEFSVGNFLQMSVGSFGASLLEVDIYLIKMAKFVHFLILNNLIFICTS
jgi:hypothetical protein